MVTDAAGNRYVTINGAFRSSSCGIDIQRILDLDPGPGVNATMMTAGLVKLDPNGAVVWTAPLTRRDRTPVRVLPPSMPIKTSTWSGDFRGTIDVDPGPGVTNVTSTANGTDYGFTWRSSTAPANCNGSARSRPMNSRRSGSPWMGPAILDRLQLHGQTTDPPMDVDAGPGPDFVQQNGPRV